MSVPQAKILVLDDDATARRLLQALLEEEGFSVQTYSTIQHASLAIQRETFDLYLLDIVLPDGDGLEICRKLRERALGPIIMLTMRGSLTDVVAGLEIGADDYVIKPFRPPELLARVRAQLRKFERRTGHSPVLRVGPILFDRDLHDVLVDGKPVHLSPKEYELLELLASRAGRVMSKDAILEAVWSDAEDVSEKILAVYIRRLRCKIEASPDDPRYLQTVRGVGYRLTP
jgi:DNA-binding response OmpR family regulator